MRFLAHRSILLGLIILVAANTVNAMATKPARQDPGVGRGSVVYGKAGQVQKSFPIPPPDEVIARIDSLSGTVEIAETAKTGAAAGKQHWRKAQVGEPLYYKMKVRTSKKSEAFFLFPDKCKMRIEARIMMIIPAGSPCQGADMLPIALDDNGDAINFKQEGMTKIAGVQPTRWPDSKRHALAGILAAIGALCIAGMLRYTR